MTHLKLQKLQKGDITYHHIDIKGEFNLEKYMA